MKKENEQAIGFFDSGVGGLTVVNEVFKQLPNEKIVYIGDAARSPFGPRPKEQVKQFSWELTNFLRSKQIKMLVISCNTATAAVLDEIKDKLPIPVIGVILPGARAALKATKSNNIGVIGTVGTIHSGAYKKILQKKKGEVLVQSLACPRFVSLVESNQAKSAIAKKVVAETLQAFKYNKPDTLILGCTHYPLLKPIIQQVMGNAVTLIDSGAETVRDVSMLLDYFDLSAKRKEKLPQHEFYTTGNPKMFQEIAENWLDTFPAQVEYVSLADLVKIGEQYAR